MILIEGKCHIQAAAQLLLVVLGVIGVEDIFIRDSERENHTPLDAEKQENGDWLLFGYCHIFEWEWGYLYLSELEGVELPYGLTIEREMYNVKKQVKDYFIKYLRKIFSEEKN